MSRWHEQLENHQFKKFWGKILEIAKVLEADDASISTDVEEVARFRKVVLYIDDVISACDPELVPQVTWQNFLQQCQQCLQQVNEYQNDRNIGHIKNANSNLDNLISYVAPHVRDGKRAATAAIKAFKEYQSTVIFHLNRFNEKIENLLSKHKDDVQGNLEEITDYRNEALEILNNAKMIEDAFSALNRKYIKGTDAEVAVFDQIDELYVQLQESHSHSINYRDEIESSIKPEISSARSVSIENKNEIEEALEEVQGRLSDLKKFYIEIYGYEEDDKKVAGLKQELARRIKELSDFEAEHKKKHSAFVEEIEALVSGATSAGLAKAYYDLKNSFDGKIQFYSRVFYAAMAGLFIVSMFSLTSELGWFYIKLVDTSSLSALLPNIVNKLPFLLPIVWLAIFASKRRSEADRLQQEYAHKEAMATSYESFKKQINDLNNEDPAMMEKLLSAAINAISDNASITLDGKHGDKTPLHELVEKVVPDLEKLSKALPKSSTSK